MDLQRKLFFFFGDAIVMVMAFFATIYISFPNNFREQISIHAEPFVLMYAVWFLALYIFDLYDHQNINPTVLSLQRIMAALLVSGAVGIMMFYLFPIFSITPKSNLLINLFIFGVLFIIFRRLSYSTVSKRMVEYVGIMGTRKEAQELFQVLKDKNPLGYHAVIISDSIDQILASNERVTRIIIAKAIDTDTLMKITKRGLQTMTLVQAFEQAYEKIPVSLMDDDMTVLILSKEKNIFYKLITRLLSVSVSVIILLATLPVTIITAIIIKLEDGRKIFYKQARVGKNHEHFLIWKFQSMKANAESNGAVWAKENDPRITKFGQIIRKLHIDEIPQMINVIKGDITLVGPRPERPEFVSTLEKEVPYYFLRHSITPGFTGWAQIKYRYARTVDDSQDKFEYDLYYLKNRNLFLDIGIILKTVQIIFTH